MEANIIKFPESRIVRQVKTEGVQDGNRLHREREANKQAKDVFDNLCFELFDTYKVKRVKEIEMLLPMLEDIIKGIFKTNLTAPDVPEPEPPRYA